MAMMVGQTYFPSKKSVHMIRQGRKPIAVVLDIEEHQNLINYLRHVEDIFRARQEIHQNKTVPQKEAFAKLGL